MADDLSQAIYSVLNHARLVIKEVEYNNKTFKRTAIESSARKIIIKLEELQRKDNRHVEYSKMVDEIHEQNSDIIESAIGNYEKYSSTRLYGEVIRLNLAIGKLDALLIKEHSACEKKQEVKEKSTLTKDVKKGIDYVFGPSSEDLDDNDKAYDYISDFIK